MDLFCGMVTIVFVLLGVAIMAVGMRDYFIKRDEKKRDKEAASLPPKPKLIDTYRIELSDGRTLDWHCDSDGAIETEDSILEFSNADGCVTLIIAPRLWTKVTLTEEKKESG